MPHSTCSTRLMSVVAAFFPVVLAATEVPASASSAQMILAACKTVGIGSTHVDVHFCEDALGSVAGAVHSLNYQHLAGLTVGLLIDNATTTESKIVRLLADGGGGVKHKAENTAAVDRCLRSCMSLYGGIIDGGPPCMAAVKARKFGEATMILEKAAAAGKECEDGFGKSNLTMSPLMAEDRDVYELAKLGVGLLRFA